MKKILSVLVTATPLFVSSIASATPIYGQGTPTDDSNLTGGTVIDFESVGTVTTPSLSLSGVTFTSDTNIEIDSDFAGGYNTRGSYHMTNHGDDPTTFRFDFDGSVDAFAFLWGAADVDWVLTAYNGSTVLETLTLDPTKGSNAGDYYGIASNNITHAILNIGSYGWDYVFIDNFTYSASSNNSVTAVPEPTSIALLAAGVAGFGFARRKKRA